MEPNPKPGNNDVIVEKKEEKKNFEDTVVVDNVNIPSVFPIESNNLNDSFSLKDDCGFGAYNFTEKDLHDFLNEFNIYDLKNGKQGLDPCLQGMMLFDEIEKKIFESMKTEQGNEGVKNGLNYQNEHKSDF